MSYLINESFIEHIGFTLKAADVLSAVADTNLFLQHLPENLYRSIDYKTLGAMIGAVFCDKLSVVIPDTAINPIEKGHPDLIPAIGLLASERTLRNYPLGLEIKGTIGNIPKGTNLRAGQQRIDWLCGLTWQAHHREVNHLLGFVWDFANLQTQFSFPMIIGVFYSGYLNETDWGAISGTTGRNTKVTAMVKSGKEKMGQGWVVLLNEPRYLEKLHRFLYISGGTE